MKAVIGLAVIGGAIGFGVGGPGYGLAGLAIGAVASRNRHLAPVGAAAMLLATALFTITEGQVGDVVFAEFSRSRPIANGAGRLALVFWAVAAAQAWRRRRTTPDDEPSAEATVEPRSERSVSSPGTVAVVGATGLMVLGLVGDARWSPLVLPGAVALTLVVAALLAGRRIDLRPVAAARRIFRGDRREGDVAGGSLQMLVATGAVSVGSFVFWVLAARIAEPSEVGGATALFSAVVFLNYLTSFGLPIALTRFGRDRDVDAATLFTACLVATGVTSVIGVSGFAALAPDSIGRALDASPVVGWLLIGANTVGMSVSALVDARCMTLGLYSWILWRSVAIAVVRLPLLALTPDDDPTIFVFGVAIGAYSATGFVVLIALAATGRDRLGLRSPLARLVPAGRYALVHFAGQLAVQGPFFAIPVIALSRLAPDANANFYLAWGVMTVVAVSLQLIAQVLLAEGRPSDELTGQARTAEVVGLGVSFSALVAVVVARPAVTALYGDRYADMADLLIILMAGTIPFGLTVITLSHARVRHDTATATIISVGFLLAVLVPALFLATDGGATALSTVWLVGNLLAAVVTLTQRARLRTAPAPAPHPLEQYEDVPERS